MLKISYGIDTAHSPLREYRYISIPRVNLHTASRLERENNQSVFRRLLNADEL